MWTGVCQKCSCEPSHKKNPSMEGQPSHLIQSSASSICLMHMIHDLPWLAMAYILQLLSSGIPEAGNTSSVTFNIKTRLKVLQQCLSHVVRNQAHLQSVRLKYSMYPPPPPPKKKKEYFPFLFIPRGFLINSPSYRILGEEGPTEWYDWLRWSPLPPRPLSRWHHRELLRQCRCSARNARPGWIWGPLYSRPVLFVTAMDDMYWGYLVANIIVDLNMRTTWYRIVLQEIAWNIKCATKFRSSGSKKKTPPGAFPPRMMLTSPWATTCSSFAGVPSTNSCSFRLQNFLLNSEAKRSLDVDFWKANKNSVLPVLFKKKKKNRKMEHIDMYRWYWWMYMLYVYISISTIFLRESSQHTNTLILLIHSFIFNVTPKDHILGKGSQNPDHSESIQIWLSKILEVQRNTWRAAKKSSTFIIHSNTTCIHLHSIVTCTHFLNKRTSMASSPPQAVAFGARN